MKGNVLLVMVLCAMSLLSGCDIISLLAPFKTAGVYKGVWQGTISNGQGGTQTCAVSFELNEYGPQDLLRGFGLSGKASVYFSCTSLLDDIAERGLPSRVTVDIAGFLLPNGGITLGSVKTNEDLSVVVGVNGKGEELNGDNQMDRLSGKWSMIIDQKDYPRITITGNVQADALTK